MSIYKLSMHNDSESLGFIMHDVARMMRARFDARARRLGATRQQWRVLLALARLDHAPTQAELAERLDVEQITLCRMADRLSDAGLVERRSDARDRRVRRLHLLPPAYPLVEKLGAIAVELEVDLLRSLPEKERPALRDALIRLRAGLRENAGDDERQVA